MTVRLSVRTAIWRSHVARTVGDVEGLVPVVKGNGYGFGRERLAALASEFSDTIAVGTVHELDVVPPDVHAVVLTPVLAASLANPEVAELIAARDPILTVSTTDHIAALDGAGWRGRVVVKGATAMQRYGVVATSVSALVDHARTRDLDVVGVSLHPPLVGEPDDRRGQIIDALEHIDPALPVWVSHLEPDSFAGLPDTHHYRLRLGTALWHGDKSMLQLSADVIEARSVRAGDTAGYRLGTIPTDGHLVMIGAGTANGVTPLPDGRSPFHFERTRLALHEPPHMHTSMAFVPFGDPLPVTGDRVDLQRPLTMTTVDEFEWL